jgi:hypothetical protein
VNLLTLPETAVRLELSGLELMALVEAGRLPAQVRRGRLAFDALEVERFRTEERSTL